MVKRLSKLGISLLTLDGDAEKSGEARKEVGVRSVELTGVRAVDLQHTEGAVAFTASRDKDVDRAPDAMVGQELRCAKPRFFL
jgi:hypothetical protein